MCFKLWKRAAKHGHTRAMFYLGTCYDNGYGVRKNLRLAFDWYLQAAKLGHRDSQFNIVYFYARVNLFERIIQKKYIGILWQQKLGL